MRQENMLYVQQSLGPNEEILAGARFHWMYTLSSFFWVFFGALAAAGISFLGIWWTIRGHIALYYPNLPGRLWPEAWQETVTYYGGYDEILWHVPLALRIFALACFVIGLLLFLHLMVVRATTEIAVTTERIVYKKGLVARHVGEISIDRIEGVSVFQGVLGRILGYGRVVIRGMGVGEVILPPISDPIDFRKAVQEAKSIQERGGTVQKNDEF